MGGAGFSASLKSLLNSYKDSLSSKEREKFELLPEKIKFSIMTKIVSKSGEIWKPKTNQGKNDSIFNQKSGVNKTPEGEIFPNFGGSSNKIELRTWFSQFKQPTQENFFSGGLIAENSFDDTPALTLYSSAGATATTGINKPTEVKETSYEKQANTVSKTTASTPSPAKATYEESKEYAIGSIQNNVIKALEAFLEQKKNQGGVSKTYDSLKDLFNKELSGTNTYRVLLADKLGSELMERANKGNLTKKEYHEAKIDLVMQLIPDKDKLSKEDVDKISQQLHGKTIEEINLLIDSLKYSENNEDAKKILKQELAKGSSAEGNGSGPKVNPNYGNEKISFEEVFKLERGVEFSPEKIEAYEQKSAQFAFVSNVSNSRDELHKQLDDSIAAADRLNNVASGQVMAESTEICSKNVETSLMSGLQGLYGNDEAKINEELKKLYGDDGISCEKVVDQNGKVSFKLNFNKSGPEKLKALTSISKKLLSSVDENCKKVLGGKTIEDYKLEYASSYEAAYGRKNSTQLARAFVNDQESAVGKAKVGASIAGGLIMAGGMLIPGPGWATSAVMLTGMLTSTVGVAAIDVVNEKGRPQGMSDEKWAEIKKELAQNVALMAAGFGAGIAGNATKAGILAGDAVAGAMIKAAAIATEIGTDATISLMSQMAITGQIDLKQEGIAQIMSQLMGIAAAKKALAMGNKGTLKEAGEEFTVGTREPQKTGTAKPEEAGKTKPEEVGTTKPNEAPPNTKTKPNKVESITEGSNGDLIIKVDGAEYNVKINSTNKAKDIEGITNLLKNAENPHDIIYLLKLTENHTTTSNKTLEIQTILDTMKKHPEISKEQIFNLVKNENITVGIRDDKVMFNGYEEAIKFAEKYPKQKNEILAALSKNGVNTQFIMDMNNNNIINDSNINDVIKLMKNPKMCESDIDFETMKKSYPFEKILKFAEDNPKYKEDIIKCASRDGAKLDGLIEMSRKNPESFNEMMEAGTLELINQGKAPAYILNGIDENKCLSADVLSDIRKVKNGESIVSEFPESATKAEIFAKLPDGEAAEIGGKMFVRNGDNLVELKLTKEKFLELFPPIQRYAATQAENLGDCWLVSAMDNMMSFPKGRAAIYSMFRQEGDDIYVKFPKSEKEFKFANSAIVKSSNGKNLNGAKGLQMIEQAYAFHRYNDYAEGKVTDVSQILSPDKIDEQMMKLDSGYAAKALAELFGMETIIQASKKVNGKIEDAEMPKIVKSNIEEYANSKDVFLNCSAHRNIPTDISEKYNFVKGHAYTIRGYDANTGLVKLSNPHNSAVDILIPLDILSKYIDTMDLAYIL